MKFEKKKPQAKACNQIDLCEFSATTTTNYHILIE